MTKTEFYNVLEEVMALGVDITLSANATEIWANLNTEMKSDCTLVFKDNVVYANKRYGSQLYVDNITLADIIEEVRDCVWGRDFGNATWFKIIDEA
jgi:hypothetical protein